MGASKFDTLEMKSMLSLPLTIERVNSTKMGIKTFKKGNKSTQIDRKIGEKSSNNEKKWK